MNWFISYFYHVRNLPTNVVPVSTAVWDPKWYHENKGPAHIFMDKRGVINGVRAPILSPAKLTVGDVQCTGRDKCNKDPENCGFLKHYEAYLQSLDFVSVTNTMESRLRMLWPTPFDICLMVYEKPDNPCSERAALIKWFKDNGVELKEWHPA